MSALRSREELHRTLVLFTSDNGFLWEEHGLEGKGSPYLPGTYVPLLARWTGHLPAGVKDTRRAANIDISPTIIDAMGVRVPDRYPMDGRSLLTSWRRARMLTEFQRVWTARAPTWAALRTRRFHCLEYYRGGEISFREYYALRKDPWELVNVLRDGAPRSDPDLGRLHRRLAALRRCEGSECP